MNFFARHNIFICLYQPRHWGPPQIFVMDVIHHAEEVERFVALIGLVNIVNPASNSIDRFIRQFFREAATARRENRHQPPPNLFVEESSPFAIRIKPAEQPIKILLPEFFELFRG